MVKRCSVLLAAVSLPLLIPFAALAQQQEAPVYTYVAEWTVERARWGDFSAFLDKNTKPVLNRLVSDGTILEWGSTENTIHTDERSTHSVWWAAPAFSGTQRVLDELAKVPGGTGAQPGITKHRDYLLRSIIFRSRHSGETTGYLLTSYNVVKPGKGREWRELWEKNTKPALENLLEQRTILGYGLDVEHVHTGNPGGRYAWIVAPNAEAVDKVNAAFDAIQQKLTPEARREMGAAYLEVSAPEAHRDGLERIVNYVRK
jgi:hypothetical protein